MKNEKYREALRCAITSANERGLTDRETAKLIGYTTSYVYKLRREFGLEARHAGRQPKHGTERLELISDRLRSGATLQSIGDELGVTRERVRQLAKKVGKTGKCGLAVRAIEAEKQDEAERNLRQAKREQRTQELYGCSHAELTALNNNLPERSRGSRAERYSNQMHAVLSSYGYVWNITFPQWCAMWDASGKWEERGLGFGYQLRRIDRNGKFEAGNVEIVSGAEGMAKQRKIAPWGHYGGNSKRTAA